MLLGFFALLAFCAGNRQKLSAKNTKNAKNAKEGSILLGFFASLASFADNRSSVLRDHAGR